MRERTDCGVAETCMSPIASAGFEMTVETLRPQQANVNAPRLNLSVDGECVTLDRDECLRLGRALHDEYVGNRSYPHIVIDDLFPAAALRRMVDEFPARQAGAFADQHSNLKTGYQMEKIRSNYISNFLNMLNSSQFLGFLEELTGIRGLLTDPHFAGGGLHETARGGHLSIHADFNIHKKLRVRRRMNLILFLNEDWKEEYGGHLELWERDMSACARKVLPLLGRAVVFNTESDSYHGHPDPTTSPESVFRRSIALYYYTAPDGAAERTRTTDFKVRPGSSDRPPSITRRIRELGQDLTPPLVARWLKGRRH